MLPREQMIPGRLLSYLLRCEMIFICSHLFKKRLNLLITVVHELFSHISIFLVVSSSLFDDRTDFVRVLQLFCSWLLLRISQSALLEVSRHESKFLVELFKLLKGLLGLRVSLLNFLLLRPYNFLVSTFSTYVASNLYI